MVCVCALRSMEMYGRSDIDFCFANMYTYQENNVFRRHAPQAHGDCRVTFLLKALYYLNLDKIARFRG